MKIIVRKDGEGYLAEVRGHPHLFAWASTRQEARAELKNVVEMMLDYHLEQIEVERKVRTLLATA
jgi:predicted RNase H-like HicB family nuclease